MSVFKNILIKYAAAALILLTAVFTAGCDQVDIIEPVNIYKENVVVRAELIANKTFAGVVFTKTLPIGTTYSPETAGLRDIEAYIKVNGNQVIPLHNAGNGLYKTLYDYKIKQGTYYELFAKHYGDPIYSKTYVPEVPNVRNVMYRSESFYLQGEVQANQKEAYGATWSYQAGSSGEMEAGDFYSIGNLPATSGTGKLIVRSLAIPEQYRGSGIFSKFDLKVYAFDKAFQNYFRTKGNGKAVEDSFIHGGDNIGWNIQGRNAIGLFIGYSVSAPIPQK